MRHTPLQRPIFTGSTPQRWALGRYLDRVEGTTLPGHRTHPNLAPGALPAPGEEPFGTPLLQTFPGLEAPPAPALASLPRNGRELRAFYEALALPRPGPRRLPLSYAGDFHRASLVQRRRSWVEHLFGSLDGHSRSSILAAERRRALRELPLGRDEFLVRWGETHAPGGSFAPLNDRTLLELERYRQLRQLDDALTKHRSGLPGDSPLVPEELLRVGYRAVPDNGLWLSQANGFRRDFLEEVALDPALPQAMEELLDYALHHHWHHF